jgi:N-methylhydantoinase A/oxoprolinase/acetone carboxylase beta subunit
MRIGIDVGGTNTDAVLMDGLDVLGWRKTPTTPDVGTGIIRVLRDLLGETKVAAADIRAVMIGTTHFTNAIVERRRLVPVAAIRLGLPATRSLPPLTDWPDDLAAAVGRHRYMLRGGNEFDGREIAPLDEIGVRNVARELKQKNITAAAISSVFSPVTAEMEQRTAAIVAEEVPGIRLSLSHEIGRIGFLERENATVMNACLVDLAFAVVSSFRRALRELKVEAPFFISQNDGTLMVPEHVEKYPVLTFASGPTNSMRGAALLAGLKEAMVVDIGGTTSDVGMLIRGFPREAAVSVDIGGVRTNFRMPDVLAIGLGGGSLVREDGARIGPDSVGYELTSKALVFGGDVLTTTDIVVAAGLENIGDRARVKHLRKETIETALATIHRMADTAVDRMKTSAEPLPVILVGGGAILVSRDLQSASTVLRPEHSSVANAIGAAVAQVGGEVDRVFAVEGTTRDAVLGIAKREASDRAIAAGAQQDSVKIVDVEDVPLAYLPGNATRIRVKAVGDLAMR